MSQKPLERGRASRGFAANAECGHPAERAHTVAAPTPAVDTGARAAVDTASDAAAAERKQRMAASLLASARHELRSPLQALLGFSELLESAAYGTLSSAQRTFVEHMRTAGQELAATVEVCTDLANALISPVAPAADVRADEHTRVTDALATALSRRPEDALVSVLLAGPVDGSLTARANEASLVRSVELAIAAVAPFAQQRIAIDVVIAPAHVDIEFSSDRSAPDDILLEVDDALVAGVRGRSFLWLKLAGLTLKPFGAVVSCSNNHRRARITLERLG